MPSAARAAGVMSFFLLAAVAFADRLPFPKGQYGQYGADQTPDELPQDGGPSFSSGPTAIVTVTSSARCASFTGCGPDPAAEFAYFYYVTFDTAVSSPVTVSINAPFDPFEDGVQNAGMIFLTTDPDDETSPLINTLSACAGFLDAGFFQCTAGTQCACMESVYVPVGLTSSPAQFTFDPALLPAGHQSFQPGDMLVVGATSLNPPACPPFQQDINGNNIFPPATECVGSAPVSVSIGGTALVSSGQEVWGAVMTLPAPVASQLNPQARLAFGPAFQLAVDGTQFVQGAVVQWDGQPLTTVQDGGLSELLGTVTPGLLTASGNHTITVLNPQVPDGGGTSNALTFQVVPLTVAPRTGPVDGGTLVTVSGFDFTSGTTVTFGGVSGSGFHLVSSAGATISTPPHVAGAVDVVVTNSDGPSTLVNGFSYTSASTPLTISPPTAMVAPRGAEQFTASGGTGTGYAWSLSTNASNGTIDAVSGAYVAGPKGSVSDVVQLTDSASSFALATVTVTPSITISPSSEVLEPGSMQTFRASGGSGAGYVWSFMTNASQGTVDASTGAYTAGPTGNVTDFIQCTDSLANYAIAMVTVTKALSISPASLTVESGGIHTFTASGGSGSGYVWSFATNASGGTLNSLTGAYVAGPVSEVTDIIQLTDSLGRSTTANVMVTVVLTISPASVALMTGGSQAFTASGGSGSGYVWSLATNESNGTINASSGTYVAGTMAGSDVVQVTDSSGDVAQAGVNVKSASSSCLSVTGGDALPLLLLALLPLVRGRRRGTRGRARHGVESGRG